MPNLQKTYQIGIEHEVKCPECGNVIELDWNDDEDFCGHNCGDSCSTCKGHNVDDYDESEEDEDEEDDDDM